MAEQEGYGRGLADTVEIQRRFNEADAALFRQVQLSGSEDPVERIRQITEAMAEHSRTVDTLIGGTNPCR